ncbi:MAG TPA: sulfite oxidase [Rubrivivax sp.]|nr:sulfite oxidase [Burkholderiales bacterium]HNU10665.1 sulfite oxidase [Rubrivivax sp.]
MQDPQAPNPSRRRALFTGGALAAMASTPELALADGIRADPRARVTASGAKALPEYASWKDRAAMTVHSANTIELRRSYMGQGALTPIQHLYVRNNLNPPSEDIVRDPDSWVIEFAGVGKPMRTTLGELKRIDVASVAMVLQCSGNGRGYFPHKPSGTQWREGAAGCVVFTGVPLKSVAAALGGVASGMKYVTGTGGEPLPAGVDRNTVVVERSIPISALDDALLAWELNGEPLPLAHGGPLRLVVPGYMGVNHIKYVKQLAFTAEQSAAKIQQTSYRFTPVGVKGSPSAPSLWEVPVNSWITTPYGHEAPARAGRVQIGGLAFGGFSPLTGVEVSIDDGRTWQTARLFGPDLGRYAWRHFTLPVDLASGTYRIASRATNARGDVQPRERIENERGYNNNSWLDRSLELTVA